jgi:type IX secretion system PorP/SprF family membrane protein
MALKRLIVLAITGVSALQAWAQDAHFSQFYANPIYLNPAFAGVQQCPTVHANYRNQYPGLGVYQTYSTSVDQYVDALNGGLGLLILQDESANRTLRLTEASLVYSYHLKVNRKFSVLTGFQGTFRQRALDWGNLTFPDQIDPFYGFVKPTNEIAPNQTTTSNVDLSIGMVGFTENFYFGASAHHLTQPDEGFFRNGNLPVKVGAQAGAAGSLWLDAQGVPASLSVAAYNNNRINLQFAKGAYPVEMVDMKDTWEAWLGNPPASMFSVTVNGAPAAIRLRRDAQSTRLHPQGFSQS